MKRSILWPVTLLSLLLVATIVGFAFSHMPHSSNALQLRPSRAGVVMPDGFYVYQSLSQRGIRIQSITSEEDGLIVALDSSEQRILAEHALQDIFPMGFSVKRCEPPKRHLWVQKITRDQLKLG
ncbi:EnvZ/OmpR regulon moderator MzrA [Hafnia psychrotolerans]|uniref:Modulator protein MzrA n=1 Tax=Hafnia psychrotolerans TaxID=1477018 RepID=A0ABQ1H7I2_9GAMM|nr:EnvZ/OmpR regulon moderator MzrA [Hafnia psychrotolerans]GGA61428.1 modulator protein MzrA [Hafnia psychrotolerans]